MDFSTVARPKDSFAAYFQQCMSEVAIDYPDDYLWNKISGPRPQLHVTISPSELPICPIRKYFEALDRRTAHHRLIKHGETPSGESTGNGETYGAMGTLRHEISQRYLGRGGRMLGHWQCADEQCLATNTGRSARNRWMFTTYKPCGECGGPTEYQEIPLVIWDGPKGKKRKVIGGKLDGIFIDDDGALWVIDYKFTHRKTFGVSRGKEKTPHKSHLKQLWTYVWQLRKIFRNSKLGTVKGFILLYVGHEELDLKRFGDWRLHRFPISQKQNQKFDKWVKHQIEFLNAANDSAEAQFARIQKGKSVKQGLIEPLVDLKPCESLEHYNETMHSIYNPCPYANKSCCFGQREKFVKQLKQDTKKYEEQL